MQFLRTLVRRFRTRRRFFHRLRYPVIRQHGAAQIGHGHGHLRLRLRFGVANRIDLGNALGEYRQQRLFLRRRQIQGGQRARHRHFMPDKSALPLIIRRSDPERTGTRPHRRGEQHKE